MMESGLNEFWTLSDKYIHNMVEEFGKVSAKQLIGLMHLLFQSDNK